MGFPVISDEWSALPDGSSLRTLLGVELLEVSVVSQAAYPATSAAIASGPSVGRSVPTSPHMAPVIDMAAAGRRLSAQEEKIHSDRRDRLLEQLTE